MPRNTMSASDFISQNMYQCVAYFGMSSEETPVIDAMWWDDREDAVNYMAQYDYGERHDDPITYEEMVEECGVGSFYFSEIRDYVAFRQVGIMAYVLYAVTEEKPVVPQGFRIRIRIGERR